jgi:hypothetical protein
MLKESEWDFPEEWELIPKYSPDCRVVSGMDHDGLDTLQRGE